MLVKDTLGQRYLWLIPTVVSLFIFILTLAPTVTGEDSGELITAAHCLGIAHPPGYPLWCLLGKLFTFLPFGTIAYRVNLLSAVIAAIAVGMLTVFIRRFVALTGKVSNTVVLGAALAFAFSRDFWAQSVIAEVYSLNILFLILVLILTFLWDDQRRPRYLYLLCFVYGLSLTNHSTMGPLGVIIAAYVLFRTPWILRDLTLVLGLSSAVIAGFSIIFYLPIRSLADPPMDWGNPETFESTIRHVLRRQYAGVEGVRPRFMAEQFVLIACFLKDLLWQFSPLLSPLIPLGAVRHYKLERRSFVLLLALFTASTYGIIWLFNYAPVREELVIRRTFFLPAYAITTVWLALGITTLLNLLPRLYPISQTITLRFAVLSACMAIPAVPLLSFYKENDKSDYYYADDFGRNLLRTLPDHAIIVPTSDHSTFPLIYLTAVEGLRPDVLIADRYGYIEENLFKDLLMADPTIRANPPDKHAHRIAKIQYLVENSRRPVFVTVKEFLPGSSFEFISRGLLFEAVKTGIVIDAHDMDQLWSNYVWHPGTFDKVYRDYTADMILADYYFARGRYQLLLRNDSDALADFNRAAMHAWGIKEVLNNLGGYLAEHDHHIEAIPLLLGAWEVEPGYPTARRNLAIAYAKAKQYKEGLKWFELQLNETPYDQFLLLAAARGASAVGSQFSASKFYLRVGDLEARDPKVLHEVRDFLISVGCASELVAAYDKKAETLAERITEEENGLSNTMDSGIRPIPTIPKRSEFPFLQNGPELPIPALPNLPNPEPPLPNLPDVPDGGPPL